MLISRRLKFQLQEFKSNLTKQRLKQLKQLSQLRPIRLKQLKLNNQRLKPHRKTKLNQSRKQLNQLRLNQMNRLIRQHQFNFKLMTRLQKIKLLFNWEIVSIQTKEIKFWLKDIKNIQVLILGDQCQKMLIQILISHLIYIMIGGIPKNRLEKMHLWSS